MILGVLFSYYLIIGESAFPDYENYITIVLNGGYLYSPEEYFFEFFSRFILTLDTGNANINVDLLTFISQTFSIVYFIVLSFIKPWSGFALVAISSVLYLTTMVRAAPAYVLLGYVGLKNFKFLPLIVIFIVAIGWHDTALLPFGMVIISSILDKVGWTELAKNLFTKVYWVIAFLLFLINFIRPLIIDIIQDRLGIRASYLHDLTSHSFLKLFYIFFIYVGSYYIIKKSSITQKNANVLYMLNIFCVFLYIINGTAGVRFAGYTIVFLLSATNWQMLINKFARPIIYLIFIVLYFITYIDILKNTIK